MNLKTIKGFIKWSEKVPYLDVVEGAWTIVNREGVHKELVYSVQGLCELDNQCHTITHSGKKLTCRGVIQKVFKKDGFVIINLNDGYYNDHTIVFLESQEVK